MGYSVLLDIVGSIIVGGMILLILLRVNENAVKSTYVYGGELIVQKNLVEVVELIEHDFRRIGYCEDYLKIKIPALPNQNTSIIAADTSMIYFITDVAENPGDLAGDGELDSIKYFLGSTDELNVTPNPSDRLLYRQINEGALMEANLGVTQFRLTYFNDLGQVLSTPVAVPGEIFTIQIDVKVENPAAYLSEDKIIKNIKNGKPINDAEYSSAMWKQIRLAAKNLRNR